MRHEQRPPSPLRRYKRHLGLTRQLPGQPMEPVQQAAPVEELKQVVPDRQMVPLSLLETLVLPAMVPQVPP